MLAHQITNLFTPTPPPKFDIGQKVRHKFSGFVHYIHEYEYKLVNQPFWSWPRVEKEGWHYRIGFAKPIEIDSLHTLSRPHDYCYYGVHEDRLEEIGEE